MRRNKCVQGAIEVRQRLLLLSLAKGNAAEQHLPERSITLLTAGSDRFLPRARPIVSLECDLRENAVRFPRCRFDREFRMRFSVIEMTAMQRKIRDRDRQAGAARI